MKTIIGLTVICALIFLYARFVEPNIIVRKKVKIVTNRMFDDGRCLKISLVSDFHYPRYTTDRMVQRAFAKSDLFDPDLVFILGDFFDKNRHAPAVLPDNIAARFGSVRSKLGVFGVLGNHDYWFDENGIRKILQSQTNIFVLDNSTIHVEVSGKSIYIVGVGDLWCKDVDYREASKNIPDDALIILLSHNPDVIESIDDPRILVQFSGHTHGGQVRLPFIGALRVPSKFGNKYCHGLVQSGHHPLYVNSGICSMKHIRFLCPPEVTWMELS